MILVDPPLTRVDVWRIALAATGIAVVGLGVVFAVLTIPADRYLDVAAWAIAAIVVHDGLLAPLVALVAVSGRRAARSMGPAAAAVARTGFVVAACCALVAIPGIVVRAIGPRNDTIHSVDYVAVLAAIWVLAIALAVGAMIVAGVRARRVRARTM